MEKAEQYTYKQALKVIENFNQITDIRNFCTNYCVGRCCLNCYRTNDACHKNEGRRISCSMYLCSTLRKLIFTPQMIEIYHRIMAILTEKVTLMKKGLDEFYTPDTKIINSFRIDKEVIDRLKKFDIQYIWGKVRSIENIMADSRKFHYGKYPHISCEV